MSVGGGGLSAGGGQVDVSALLEMLSSKDGLKARIAEFQAARQAFEKAQADLNLGKSVRDAYDGINAAAEAAKKKNEADRAALEKELASLRDQHNAWKAQVEKEVEQKLANAKVLNAKAESLVEERAAAHKDAERIKSESIRIYAEADRAKRHADATEAKAEATIKDYEALKTKYETAIRAIKSAVASI